MIDALLGSVILVVATGSLMLLVQFSETAITPVPRPCNDSNYETKVVISAAKGMSYAQAVKACAEVSQWLADRRTLP
jgi:hypothetical protein